MSKLRRKIIRKATRLAVKSVKKSAMRHASEAARETAEKYKENLEPRVSGNIVLRSMRKGDRAEVLEMMREFYSSEATLTNGSDEIFSRDIAECLSDRPFLQGYVFAFKDADNSLWGYAMTAHSFSTEFGRDCIWIEDLYLREEARGLGLASFFFDYLEERYPEAVFRLEAENGNEDAMEVYKHRGFLEFPYTEMIRENNAYTDNIRENQ